ncbi:MAG: hypothetical protein K5978_02320 [Campylobacter sp.]|nr:hypothetical protein [Campylobacter sp.]
MKINRFLYLFSLVLLLNTANASELFDEFKKEYDELNANSECSDPQSEKCLQLIKQNCKNEKDKEFCKDYTIRWSKNYGADSFQICASYYAKATQNDDIDAIKQIFEYSKQDYTQSGFVDIFSLIIDSKAKKSLEFFLEQNGEADLEYLQEKIKANPSDESLKEMLNLITKTRK